MEDVDRPSVGDDDVLIRVRATGVNTLDWVTVAGVPYVTRLKSGLRQPSTPVRGTDVAGVVEAVGKDLTDLQPGDEVFGSLWDQKLITHPPSTFAEFTVVPASQLIKKPVGLTFGEAAASVMSGLTALIAVRDVGRVGAGTRVLINGASGGVGTFAVQIAKALGAEVTGVCSTRNVDMVRSIGADHVIDYTGEDFTQGGPRYDFILDNVGNHSLSACRHALTPEGTFQPSGAQVGGSVGGLGRPLTAFVLSLFVRRQLRPFLSLPKKEDLVVLKELVEAGKVTPVIDRTYPLSETPNAIGYIGEGYARGKVVITV